MERLSRHLQSFRPTFIRHGVLNITCSTGNEEVFLFSVSQQSSDITYQWTLQKTYKHFRALSKAISQDQQTLQIGELSELIDPGKFTRLSHEARLEALESYLVQLGERREVCLLPSFMDFAEVSALSFDGTSKKHKEGYVWKRTGGRRANEERTCYCSKYFRRYQRRWLIVRDTMVGYMTTNTSEILHESLLFKGKFVVKTGRRDTGYSDGVRILTSQRVLTFRAGSELAMLEWEKAIQMAYKDSDWNQADNPYSSSFPARVDNEVQWYVDGEDYFSSVYEALSHAQREVCITDWWMSPELYLLRPPVTHPHTQLVEVLGQLADRGVAIYVCLYKEVKFALTLNSMHTRDVLQGRSEKIKVLRHPHRSVVGGEFLWSHHEKILCIDQQIAFVGGLDLCFGRWDTSSHPLFDSTPALWPGIDYSNSRICDFVEVQNWHRDSINRDKIPRMPWHDVSVKITGKTASDIALHFIELYNHVMTDITGRYHRTKVLLQPGTVETEKQDPVVEVLVPPPTPDRKLPFEIAAFPEPDAHLLRFSRSLNPADLKSNYPPPERKTEGKPHKHINIEQFQHISDDSENSRAVNIAESKVNMEIKEFVLAKIAGKGEIDEEKGTILRSNTAVLGTSGDEGDHELQEIFNKYRTNDSVLRVRSEVNRDRIEENDEAREKAEIIEKSAQNDEQFMRNLLKISSKMGIREGNCSCQVLRSGGRWSLGLDESEVSIHTGYLHLIDSADHFIYIENQFFISSTAGPPVRNQIAQALVERIKVAADKDENFHVFVVLPLLPAFEGAVDDSSAAVLRVELHWEYATICRGVNSIFEQLRMHPGIRDPEKYISFYGLRTHAVSPGGEPTTEIVYVHSKLMIVDDEYVLLGSANINDRSLIGSHDSEVAVLIHDPTRCASTLNSTPTEVSSFAYSLRLKLWKEHSGIEEESVLQDPLNPEFVARWKGIAKRNTEFYREVFQCYPDDTMERIADIKAKAALARPHTYDPSTPKGLLTQFPLNFLCKENLKLSVFNTEFYIPEQNFV